MSGYDCFDRDKITYYKIGLFSQINRVTIKTLRHYDDIGLLKPAKIDEENGYRYYTSDQLPILHNIVALKQIGLSLDEIKKVINGGVSTETVLLRKKSDLLKSISELTLKLSQVEYYLTHKDLFVDYNVVIKELPEVIVSSVRKILPSYDSLFDMMPYMGREMERLGCECAVPEYCFTMYHDGEYREENIDAEICEAVTEMKENSDIITFKKIPAVKTAACVYHKGPYSEFPKAYGAAFKWMEENDYELDGYPRESYIDGIWNKESENDWLTELQFPVRRKL